MDLGLPLGLRLQCSHESLAPATSCRSNNKGARRRPSEAVISTSSAASRFGVYPDVSLKRARLGRDQARQLLVDGIDPSAQRQADKQSRRITFEAVASEWLELQAQNLAAITLAKAYL